MRVFGTSNDPLPWTNPFPTIDTDDGIPGEDGFIWALRGGDVCSPDSWGLPVHVKRWYCRWPVLPFFSYRRGRFGFYIGWKCFGVDNVALKGFPSINQAEVYDGSVALQGFTWRFSLNLPKA